MSEPKRPPRDKGGRCLTCQMPEEAYHSRTCEWFNGYYCFRCDTTYFDDYCPKCPPWWAKRTEEMA